MNYGQLINMRLWVVCLSVCGGMMFVVGCESGEKSSGSEVSAQALESSEQSSEDVGETELKVRLVDPDEPAADQAKESPPPAVVSKPQVAESESKPMSSDIYADRPDPFSERRIKKLEAGLGDLSSIAMPDEATRSE